MAIINPSSLYSAGNVALDSTPYARMAQQQRAKQTAINEAAYRHYSELPDKLNVAGVRQQDLQDPNGSGGINNDLSGIREYWDVNKNSIMRGGRSQQEYAKKIQLAQQRIEESKQTGKLQMEIGKAFFDGKHDRDENDLKIDGALNESIYSDNHYKDKVTRSTYGMNDYSSATPDYSSQRESQADKVALGNAKPQENLNDVQIDENAWKIGNKLAYKPEDIYSVSMNKGRIVADDKTLNKHYKKMLMNDPNAGKIASEALSKIAGVEVVVNTPEQLATGLKAAELMSYSDIKWKDDRGALNKAKVESQLRNFAFKKAENAKKEAGKDRRTPSNAVEFTNPYKTLVDNAVAIKTPKFAAASISNPLGQPEMETEDFAPIELLTAAQRGFMIDLPSGQKNALVERGGKLGLILKNGILYGSNGEIDQNVVKANVNKALGGSMGKEKAGKITFGDKGTAPKKGFSLNASDRKKHN